MKKAKAVSESSGSKLTKGQTTLKNIIHSATHCFADNGFSNASISDIAERANLSVGAIYRYFDTKLELYRAVITRMQKKIRDANSEAIAHCSNRIEKEREGMKAWFRIVREHPDLYRLIWESLYIDTSLFNNYYISFGKAYASSLKEEKDSLTNDDYTNIAFFLIGVNTFLGVKLLLDGKEITDEEIDHVTDTAMDILSNGLLKKK